MCIVIVCEPACDVINFEISKLYNLFCIYLASYVCNLCTCLLIHLRESKKSFITFSTLDYKTKIIKSFDLLEEKPSPQPQFIPPSIRQIIPPPF